MNNETALQLPLLSSVDMPATQFLILESKGVYTSDRFRAQRPEDYQMLLSLLSEGVGVMECCRILGVSHHTVRAVRDRNPETIAVSKERVGSRFRHAAELCAELGADAAARGDSRTARDSLVAAGVAVDKWSLLAGEATQRIEHVIEDSPDLETFNVWVTTMHPAPEKPDANASLDDPARQVIDVESSPASDSDSRVMSSDVVDSQCPDATTSPPAGALHTGAAPETRGGGGSGGGSRGPAHRDASTHGNFQCSAAGE